jgi:phage tail-like protein
MPPDPPTAFYFTVRFAGQGADIDASFQEVSGIGHEMETESFHEGGENRFVHQLPKGVKHPRLTLKRGVAPIESKLVAWCRETLEGGLGVTVKPASDVEVSLLDGEGGVLRQWTFTNVFPVHWTVDAFVSTKNELAIEKIELAYAVSQRKK